MTERVYGAKYQRELDVAEIAKRVRVDIKDAVKVGALPKGKYSVTIARYSMGQSIDVCWRWDDSVKELLLNGRRLYYEALMPHHSSHHYPAEAQERFSTNGRACTGALERILSAYNYDHSDSQSDYSDVNCHEHIHVDSRWEDERRKIEGAEARRRGEERDSPARRPRG